tara:strand:+ start:193 stop:564 length:372 start_codon:yes stop_codon:yes gene_type:complete
MANTNLTGNGTVVMNTRVWAGSNRDDTTWLQSPIGSNSGAGAPYMAVVDVIVADGDAAWGYDLGVATNVVNGSEVLGILSVMNRTTAAGNQYAMGNHTGTEILFAADANGVDADVVRIVFLYR